MTPERMHHGFIAQEYKEVMPDATYYDEEYEKLCIDTNDLIGLCWSVQFNSLKPVLHGWKQQTL